MLHHSDNCKRRQELFQKQMMFSSRANRESFIERQLSQGSKFRACLDEQFNRSMTRHRVATSNATSFSTLKISGSYIRGNRTSRRNLSLSSVKTVQQESPTFRFRDQTALFETSDKFTVDRSKSSSVNNQKVFETPNINRKYSLWSSANERSFTQENGSFTRNNEKPRYDPLSICQKITTVEPSQTSEVLESVSHVTIGNEEISNFSLSEDPIKLPKRKTSELIIGSVGNEDSFLDAIESSQSGNDVELHEKPGLIELSEDTKQLLRYLNEPNIKGEKSDHNSEEESADSDMQLNVSGGEQQSEKESVVDSKTEDKGAEHMLDERESSNNDVHLNLSGEEEPKPEKSIAELEASNNDTHLVDEEEQKHENAVVELESSNSDIHLDVSDEEQQESKKESIVEAETEEVSELNDEDKNKGNLFDALESSSDDIQLNLSDEEEQKHENAVVELESSDSDIHLDVSEAQKREKESITDSKTEEVSNICTPNVSALETDNVVPEENDDVLDVPPSLPHVLEMLGDQNFQPNSVRRTGIDLIMEFGDAIITRELDLVLEMM